MEPDDEGKKQRDRKPTVKTKQGKISSDFGDVKKIGKEKENFVRRTLVQWRVWLRTSHSP